MIASVDLKLKMRVRALFEEMISAMGTDGIIYAGYDGTVPSCGHAGDFRCVLASIVAHRLPGTQVMSTTWHVTVVKPDLYPGPERDIRVPLPAAIRQWVLRMSGPDGMRDRRLRGCLAVVTQECSASTEEEKKGI